MFFWSIEKLREYILSVVRNEMLSLVAHELRPGKSYILVIPTDIPPDDVQQMLDSLGSGSVDARLYVVQADKVNLVEFV